MSFSLENCNSALNPDLALEKKQKETWWVPGLKPSFCYTALPSGASLIVFFHWFGSDETRAVTTPTSQVSDLVLRDCQARLSQIHSKHDILTGREKLEVIPSVLLVRRWEIACCLFATVHCEANFELKTSCPEHIHWVYTRTTHFYYNCVVDKILDFTDLTYIIVLKWSNLNTLKREFLSPFCRWWNWDQHD